PGPPECLGASPGVARFCASFPRAATPIPPFAAAVKTADPRPDPAEAAPPICSLPVVQLLAAYRREDPGAADLRTAGVRCERCPDGEIGAPVAVEVVEPGDVPSEGPRLFSRRVGPQHRAVLAAQEIDPTAVPRG